MKSSSKNPSTRKRVGIWIRVSTEDQAKGDSPEHHEKRARCYAESRDWDVVAVYHLEAVSGKSLMGHPETQRMLKDVQGGIITGLIFSKLARLARNTKELLEFADIFRNLGADLISLQEAIDTSTPAGRLFYTIIAAMAQWEREEIADRISASVVVRAKLGKPLNGKICYGYKWEGNKIVVHPEEGPVRRLIFELYREYRRKRTVARILNERGYRTRSGGPFTDSAIQFLIRDPTAKGMHRANFTKRTEGAKRWFTIKPEKDWIWTKIEPVVSEELWDECNQILDAVHSKWRRVGRLPRHLFAGMMYCTCGKKMYVRNNSPKYWCTTCWNRIPAMDVEAIYYEQLKGFFLSPQEVAKHVATANDECNNKVALLESLEAEQSKLRTEIERVYKLYVDGELSPASFGQFYRPLEQRQNQLSEELPRLQAEVDLFKIDGFSTERVLTEAKDLYDRWPSLTLEEKQQIVESITDKIVVGKGEIDISLCCLPTSEDLVKEQNKLLIVQNGKPRAASRRPSRPLRRRA